MSAQLELKQELNRRSILKLGAGLTGLAMVTPVQADKDQPAKKGKLTKFQIACMTLPYAQFPFDRALTGIQSAGYRYVAWYTTHRDAAGKQVNVLAENDPPEKAKELGKRCRNLGLEPVLVFSGIYPEAPKAMEVFKSRILQAAAAGIPEVLTFGHTKGGNRKLWVQRFKELGPIARDQNVRIVVKQHGGETGTGAACAEIIREVADDGIKVNYDAGNVMDYLRVDPIADIEKCADEIHSFCIKDHRTFLKDEDCGPGLGEIDHYKLLHPVAFTGRVIPLCCENVFAPLVARPTKPEGIDTLARRAREFLEIVIQGLQA